MIFLTVGTQFPFDRLVKAIDEAAGRSKISEEIYAQIGDSSYFPRNFKSVSSLRRQLFDKYIRESSCIISHAGIGTIAMALSNNKPLLVMPRQKKYGEVINDHQTIIAQKFEELGHILVAYRVEDLQEKIERLKSFVPEPRQANPKKVADRITCFLKLPS